MKRILIPIIILATCCIAFSGCNHGVAKNLENANDTVDTVLVDTVEADSIIYDEEYGDIRYYEDEYLYFRYPSEYTCVQASDGGIVLTGDTLMDNYIVFDCAEVLPNENAESAVKKMVIKILQKEPKAKLTYSSDIPISPEYKGIRNQYLAIIEFQDEKPPLEIWIFSTLLKNGHIHKSITKTDNEHDRNMFRAILKTVEFR
jgi:hypothetical protein